MPDIGKTPEPMERILSFSPDTKEDTTTKPVPKLPPDYNQKTNDHPIGEAGKQEIEMGEAACSETSTPEFTPWPTSDIVLDIKVGKKPARNLPLPLRYLNQTKEGKKRTLPLLVVMLTFIIFCIWLPTIVGIVMVLTKDLLFFNNTRTLLILILKRRITRFRKQKIPLKK